MMTEINNVLELATGESASAVRNVVIDDVVYPIADLDRMSLAQQVRIERLGRVVSKPANSELDTIDDAELDAALAALDEMVRIVLPSMPDGVLAALTDMQKTRIVEVFNPGVPTSDEPESQTTSSPLPASPDSTAAALTPSSPSLLPSSQL